MTLSPDRKLPTLQKILQTIDPAHDAAPSLGAVLDDLDESIGRLNILAVANDHKCYQMWCHKVGISIRNRHLKYVARHGDTRGWYSTSTSIVWICEGLSAPGWPTHIARDLFAELQFLQDIGVELVHDRCS